jgi:tetratricopeptide (TPR) repeat protein
MGDAVNLAARLESASEAGQIFVGPTTHRLTAPFFHFEILPPLRLKGKAEPVIVHQLLGLRAAPGPARGLQGLRSPLVGRAAELQALLDAVDRLTRNAGGAGGAGGVGGAFAIVAEAGLGKSRLVAEARQASSAQTRWAEGRALSYTTGISYATARALLDNLIGVGGDAPAGEVSHALRQFVQRYLPEQADAAYLYLARLRDLPPDEASRSLFQDVLPTAMQNRMQTAFVQLIRACAAEKPLILIWEDLHWADPSSLDLLQKLVGLTADAPLLLLLILRPHEGRQEWQKQLQEAAGERYQAIELAPLTAAQSAELVENLLKIENMPAATRQLILNKSEGNPFFLEELLRSLIDTGLVLIEGDRVVAAQAISDLDVPDSLQGVIAARVDRLPGAAKQALQTAAVIGRVFQQTVLGYLLQQEARQAGLDLALDELQQRELIRWRDELAYIFKHAITRDVTYNSLLMARRKELHRLTAVTVETLFPDQLDELSATLAYHYEAAAERERAIHYLTRAADRAQQNYANAEAIAFYRAAIAQMAQSNDEPQKDGPQFEPAELVALHEKLGEILSRLGKTEEALAVYDDALVYAAQLDAITQARLYRRKGLAYNTARQLDNMFANYAQAGAILGDPSPTPDSTWQTEWLELQLDCAWAYYFSNRVAELNGLIAAIGAAIEQAGSPEQRIRFYETNCLADFRRYRFYRLPDETLARMKRQLATAEATGNRRTIGRAKTITGFVHLWRNELDEAARWFEDSFGDVEHVGDMDSLIIARSYIALVERKRDNVAATRLLAEQALALAQRLNSPFYIAVAYGSLGWAAWRAGDLTQAEAHLQEAQAAMAKFPAPNPVKFIYVGPLMAMAAARDDWETAVAHASALLDPGQQKMADEVELALQTAVTAWEDGRAAEAAGQIQKGITLLRDLGAGYV